MNYPNLYTPAEHLAAAKDGLRLPRIVAICGSTRFWNEMADADRELTAQGYVVVKPGCDLKRPHPLWADPAEAEALKVRLDALHKAKIRAADEVLVVNPGGYIGDSTAAEIAYAEELGKPVRYWDWGGRITEAGDDRRAAAPVIHELTGDVGLTDSERTVLRHALDLVAVEMEAHTDDYTDAEVEAHTALCRLADPDETPEADRG